MGIKETKEIKDKIDEIAGLKEIISNDYYEFRNRMDKNIAKLSGRIFSLRHLIFEFEEKNDETPR